MRSQSIPLWYVHIRAGVGYPVVYPWVEGNAKARDRRDRRGEKTYAFFRVHINEVPSMKTKATTPLIALTLIALAIGTMSLVDSSSSDDMMYDVPILEFGLPKTEILNRDTHQIISKIVESQDAAYLYPSGRFHTLLYYDFSEDKLSNVVALTRRVDKDSFSDDDIRMIVTTFMGRYILVTKDGRIHTDDAGYLIFVNAEKRDSISVYVHLKFTSNTLMAIYSPTLHTQIHMDVIIQDKMKDQIQSEWGDVSMPKSMSPEMKQILPPSVEEVRHVDLKEIIK